MQRKSISASSANVFNARKAAIFSTSNSMEPQLYFCYKRGNVVDTSKNILPFPCMEMVRWCNQNEVAEAMFPRNKLAKILHWCFISIPTVLK